MRRIFIWYTKRMRRIRVMLVFGGESTEHEVSIASARNVFAALDDRKYDISLCYISKTGSWHAVEDIASLDGIHPVLTPVLGNKHFVTDPGAKPVVLDVLLPILHGDNGEDGSVQGLAQLLHIPIVGCGILASAMCMDKEVTKRLLKDAGLAVADYAMHYAHEPAPHFAEITLKLGSPLFVKPAGQGSSVGVSRVFDGAGFKTALALAHKYERKVLIEQAVKGREVECAVLGNAHPEASGVGEVKLTEGDFYTYDSKYATDSKTKVVIPADLPEETVQKVRQVALVAYRALECRGLSRIDFFVTEDGTPVVNEINTLPGFTNISMYPKLWRQAGVSYAQLIDKLINLALEP